MRLGPEMYMYSMTVFTSVKNNAPSVIKIHTHVDDKTIREAVCWKHKHNVIETLSNVFFCKPQLRL
jgi:hypothetical protein